MANDKITNDVANLQATRLNNVIDPNPQYQDTTFTRDITSDFDPSCLAYLDEDGRLCVDSVTTSAELVFEYPFSELVEKGIENIRIQFSVEGEGNPIFSAIGLGSPTVKDFQTYENVITEPTDVDETITILSFTKEDIANYMKSQLFRLYIVFLQGDEVCNIKLSNIIVTFNYQNNIINEVRVIENRLQAMGFENLQDTILLSLGVGLFKIDNDGNLCVELPNNEPNIFSIEDGNLCVELNDGVENNFSINSDGFLEYEK